MSRDTHQTLSLPARLQAGLMRGASKIPPGVLALAGRWAPTNSDGERLAPEMFAVGWAAEHVPGVDLGNDDVAEFRKQSDDSVAGLAEDLPPMAAEEDLVFDGPGGELRATRYRSKTSSRGILLYFHGGGWVIGSRISHDGFVRRLAHDTGLDVVSVEYRLAPENPFPAAVEDAVAAWRFVVDAAPRWGVDPRRIVVSGDSAGGNLATVLAREVRGEDIAPLLQLLIYPVTDLSKKSASRREFPSGFFLTEEGITWVYDHYVPDLAQRTDPRCSPLLADDLSGLAPAHVVVAGFCPLRDEGLAYAERLKEAGVPVTVQREGSLIHGFANMTLISPDARAAVDRMCAAVRDAVTAAQ